MPDVESAAVSAKTKGDKGELADYTLEQFGLDAATVGQAGATPLIMQYDGGNRVMHVWLMRLTHTATKAVYERAFQPGFKWRVILSLTDVPLERHFEEGLLILRGMSFVEAVFESHGHRQSRGEIYFACTGAIDSMIADDPDQLNRKQLNITKLASYVYEGQLQARARLYYYFGVYTNLKEEVERYFESLKTVRKNRQKDV
jgi:hypothetical protein